MKQALIAGFVLTASMSAFANTVVRCEETSSNEYGYHEIFEIQINDKYQAVEVAEINWNDKTNKRAGGGTLGYYVGKPLNANATRDTLTYKFVTSDEGSDDADFGTDSRLKVTVTIPKSFTGAGVVEARANDDQPGVDHFELNCTVK